MKNYYLYRDEQTCGPYVEGEFMQMLAAGQIAANEWVCVEGGSEWVAAASLQPLPVAPDVGRGADDGWQGAQDGLDQPIQQEASPTKRRRVVMIVGLCVVALTGVITGGVVLGKAIGHQVVKVLRHRTDGVPPERSYAAGDWASRKFSDITLEAPFKFRQVPDIAATLPPQIRDALRYFEVFDSGEATHPRVSVSRMAYTIETSVSLDGAMNGAMNGAIKPIAENVGEAKPRFASTMTSIAGLPARRASYSGRKGGTVVHVDAVFVQSGQQLWQVQVIHAGDALAADAKRMLDSIRIQAER